jgi:DNA modification methylase
MSETVKLSTLIPDGKNANLGSPRGNQMIEDSLRQYGAGRSILLDKHGAIIAGNKTAENCGAIGMEDVIVVQSDGTRLVAVQRTDLDLADPKTRQLAIADNRAGQVSLDWDADTLKGLVDDGVDLAPFWTVDELEVLWPKKIDLLTDEDDVPPVPVEPITKTGDLYTLGDHRLLCGDSTKREDVERLMGGQKADMVFTDPPYNVSVCGGDHNPQGRTFGKGKRIQNDSMSDGEFHQFLVGAFTSMSMVIKDGATVYVCHADTEGINFRTAFVESGFMLKQCLIWAKQQFVFGRADYHWQHEPILYGWKAGVAHKFYGERNQGTIWSIDRPMRSEMEHPTQKPVALVEKAISNSSKSGDLLYEPFGGSGSTLIACEKTGRKCYMMELSPQYCDVIVTRWEQATGKKAVLSAG